MVQWFYYTIQCSFSHKKLKLNTGHKVRTAFSVWQQMSLRQGKSIGEHHSQSQHCEWNTHHSTIRDRYISDIFLNYNAKIQNDPTCKHLEKRISTVVIETNNQLNEQLDKEINKQWRVEFVECRNNPVTKAPLILLLLCFPKWGSISQPAPYSVVHYVGNMAPFGKRRCCLVVVFLWDVSCHWFRILHTVWIIHGQDQMKYFT